MLRVCNDVQIAAGSTLQLGATVDAFSTDGALLPSNAKVPTCGAVRTYLDGMIPPEAAPNGICDKSATALSISAGGTVVTIQPAGPPASFDYIVDGVRSTAVAAKSVTLSSGTGLYYIYIDAAGNLVATTTWSDDIILVYAGVATVYYSATLGAALLFGEERHGVGMPPNVHLYEHNTFGARYSSGLALGSFTPDQATPITDAAAQFSCDAGMINDEDLPLAIAARTVTSPFAALFYRIGSAWQADLLPLYPVKNDPVDLTRVFYNEYLAGVWQLTRVPAGNFLLAHLYATNQVTGPRWTAIMGQAQYATLAAARTGATEEVTALTITGLPMVEWVLVATIIFETNTTVGYNNAVHARIRSFVAGGAVYNNWLHTWIGRGSTPQAHINLSGLGPPADDHPQYAMVAGRPGESLASQAAVTAATFVNAGPLLKLTPGAAPGGPAEGWIYYDAAAHALKYYDGTVWKTLATL